MTKAETKREEIADRLADFLLAEGLIGASLRPLAAAVGTSDRMLLYYFKDKEAILSAALQKVTARISDLLHSKVSSTPSSPDEVRAELLQLISSEEFRPYMCVWLETAALSARGDQLFRTIGAQIAGALQQWIASRLAFPDPARRQATASRLLRAVEGEFVMRSFGLSNHPEGG